MITNMYLVRAARPSDGARLDCFVEAPSEGAAWELHKLEFGFYDSQPDYPDWKDVEIVDIPMITGEPRLYAGFEFN